MEDYLNCCEELVLALLYKDGSSQLGDPISADAKVNNSIQYQVELSVVACLLIYEMAQIYMLLPHW